MMQTTSLKALSHNEKAVLSTLCAGRSYHDPMVDWNEAWAAVERAKHFTRPGMIATRDVYIVTLARYDDCYRASIGSTGATVSIFLGRDSEAREFRAGLEVIHSFRALTGRDHNVLHERPREK